MGGGIPDRWIPYNNVGNVIPGTRFIAFKVPLKEALCRHLPEKKYAFTPCNLMDQCPNLSLVIDLTNTKRYYDRKIFEDKSVLYEKIFCPGHVLPPKDIVRRFFQVVDAYLEEHKEEDGLIGVHCTHGVNRTGYFICKYMIERLGIQAEAAINDFNTARGHDIERENYLDDLRGRPSAEPEQQEEDRRQGYRKRPAGHTAGSRAGRGGDWGWDEQPDEQPASKRWRGGPARPGRAERRGEFRREYRQQRQQQQHDGDLPDTRPPPGRSWRDQGPPPPPYGPLRGGPRGGHGPPRGGPTHRYGPPPGPPFGQRQPYGKPHGHHHGHYHHAEPYRGRPHGAHPRGRGRGAGRPERPGRSHSQGRISGYAGGERGPDPLD